MRQGKSSYNDKGVSSLRRYNYRYEEKNESISHSVVSVCDLMDCSPPGSSIHRILQVRILEWVAISFSRGSSWTRDWTCISALQADSLPFEPPAMRQRRSSYNDKGANSSRKYILTDICTPNFAAPEYIK